MKISSNIRIVLFCLIAIGAVGIMIVHNQLSTANQITSTQRTRFLMDTAIEIRATGPNSEEAVNEAFTEIARVESVFSRFIVESEVSLINAQSGRWVSVSEETIALMDKAIEYGQITDGAFDITVGILLDLWGFSSNEWRIPDQEEIEQVLNKVGFRSIEVNYGENLVRIPKGSCIDLGGIAKGHAVDQARNVLESHNIQSAMIYAGGDIFTVGSKQDGSAWRVGIQHPRQSTELLAIVELVDNTIVTSGDYERFFVAEEVRFHHIIDPATGFPARGLISVTIIADSAVDADALSTAVFVLGWESGQLLVEQLDGIEAIIVDDQESIWVSSGLEDSIQLME